MSLTMEIENLGEEPPNPQTEKLIVVMALVALFFVVGLWFYFSSGGIPDFGQNVTPVTPQAHQTVIMNASPPPSNSAPPATQPPATDALSSYPQRCREPVKSLGKEDSYKDGTLNAYIRINSTTIRSVRETALDGRPVCEVVVQDAYRFGGMITATYYVDMQTLIHQRRIERGG